jgi:hypothetical protein
LWPHIKNSIYTTPINDLAELRNRITQKINEINNNPIVLENVTNAIDEGLGCVYKNTVHIFNTYSKLCTYKIVISYCVRLCAILNLQFLLVFTAMLMLCFLLWFKEINELIRLTICHFA